VLIKNETTTTQGNLQPARRVAMTIHAAAANMVIRSLTKQYSDAPLAALREYTSNAIDSHMRAGQTRPVEVTFPTALSPLLVIRDYGVGLDAAGLDSYGQYGLSDKSNDNLENGGFGLGSKSALAMASQFTVVGVKDGFKNTVVIGITEDGGPSMDYMNDEPVPTDEPNGVTIRIPTSNDSNYGNRVPEDFFLGWKRGSILVNGKEPEYSIYDEDKFREVDGTGWINHTQQGFGNRYVGRAIVGNVLYSVSWDKIPSVPQGLRNSEYLSKVVLNLPIGTVDIPPNREEMIYSPTTIRAIEAALQGVLKEARNDFQDRIDAAEDILAAYELRKEADEYGLKSDTYNYKGQALTPAAEMDDAKRYVTEFDLLDRGGVTIAGRSTYSVRTKTLDLGRPVVYLENTLHYRTWTSHPKILVLDAGKVETRPISPNSNVTKTQHPSIGHAKGYLQWRTHVNGDNFAGRAFLHFTTLKRDEIDPLILAAYGTNILELSEVIEGSEKFKALLKKEAQDRRVNPVKRVAKQDSEMEVRYVDFGGYGSSAKVRPTTLGALDTSKTYILLQNENGDPLVQRVRKSLTTVHYRSENLNTLVETLIKEGYVFLMVHKNEKVDRITNNLSSISTLPEAVKDLAETIIAEYTPERAYAEQDASNSRYSWATYLTGRLDEIDNEVTRAWISDLTQSKSGWGKAFLKAAVSHSTLLGIDTSAYTLDTKYPARTIHPGARYTLLTDRYYAPDPSAAIEYINLLDAAKGDHA
jgi:hypothetical protein